MIYNNKRMTFEEFLLNHSERPIPPSPTHYLSVEVLNKDLSVKRITIYFNPADYWESNEVSQFAHESVKYAGKLIGDHLSFLSLDRAAQCYQYRIFEVVGDKEIYKGNSFLVGKVHYATDNI